MHKVPFGSALYLYSISHDKYLKWIKISFDLVKRYFILKKYFENTYFAFSIWNTKRKTIWYFAFEIVNLKSILHFVFKCFFKTILYISEQLRLVWWSRNVRMHSSAESGANPNNISGKRRRRCQTPDAPLPLPSFGCRYVDIVAFLTLWTLNAITKCQSDSLIACHANWAAGAKVL